MKFKNFPYKKVLTAGLVVTLGFTLNACSKDSYNTEAPYGTISGNYAVNGSTTLTNKQLYDMLRPTGYNVFSSMLEEVLLKDFINDLDFNVTADKDDMKQLIIENIFYKEDVQDIIDMSSDDFDDTIVQLIDASYTSNIYIENSYITKTTDGTGFTYTEELFEIFKIDLAKQRFGHDKLEEIIKKGEEYTETDEDGVDQTITNSYFISDEDIEKYYNDTYVNQQDYHAVIIGFNTLADYTTAFDDANFPTLPANPTDSQITTYNDDVKTSFVSLYNSAFPYKTQLLAGTEITTSKTFEINADKLANYDTTLSAFIDNMEAGDFTTTYKEFGERYYMVYRISEFADTEWADYSSTDDIEFADGNTETYENVKNEIYQELFDAKLTDSFISEQINEMITDLIDQDKITIYDPVTALIFSSNYTDYIYDAEKLEDTTNIAKIDTSTIKVDDYFDLLIGYYGVEQSMDYFINCAIAGSTYISKLTSDDIDTAEAALEAAISNYEEDSFASNGVTSVFTEEQFLSMMYGFDNQKDVLNNYFKPQQAITYITNDYDSDLYWALLSLTGENNYNNYFSLNIKHVLLYVDYDGDGTLDDPEEFMAELSTSDKTTFQKTILDIYAAIYEEAQYLSGSISENLDRIVNNYNRDTEINYLKTGAKWSSIRGEFNIVMQVEDLGSVNNSTASTYVPEFSEHVVEFYNTLEDDALTTLNNTDTTSKNYFKDRLEQLQEYLDDEHLEEIDSSTIYTDLCQSVFGYHMLLSTGGDVASNAKFNYNDDIKANTGDDYRMYENIEVYFDGEDGDITTLSGYSNTPYPSLDQLKVYVAELNTDDGVESLKSTTETIISGFYSTFNSRYYDETFVQYLIYKKLSLNIVYETNSLDVNISSSDMIVKYWDICEKNLDKYTTYEENELNTYDGWWAMFNKTDAELAKVIADLEALQD